MIQYKLIKEYPGSPKSGTIEWFNNHAYINKASSDNWKGINFYNSHPEFWEKVEELDYEILSFRNSNSGNIVELHSNNLYCCKASSTYRGIGVQSKEHCINHEFLHIFSVKNLYDGEVFTTGDRVKSKRGTDNDSSLITKIYINTNKDAKPVGGLIIQTGGYYQAKINEITKVKTPLFTTEDCVDIFEGDDFFVIETQFDKYRLHKTIGGHFTKERSTRLRFYSKEKAEEYVLLNKPCLSLNEISTVLSASSPLFNNIKELAKSKL